MEGSLSAELISLFFIIPKTSLVGNQSRIIVIYLHKQDRHYVSALLNQMYVCSKFVDIFEAFVWKRVEKKFELNCHWLLHCIAPGALSGVLKSMTTKTVLHPF